MAIRNLIPKLGGSRERALGRTGEFDLFRDFQRQINRLFDEFFDEFAVAPRGSGRSVGFAFTPKVDVSETDQEVRVSAELPGMDEKDICVEMDEGAVTIRGERKEEKEVKEENWITREQSYGSFHRIIPLPAGVEVSKAKAKFKKGILTITAPKKVEDEKTRRAVKIETD